MREHRHKFGKQALNLGEGMKARIRTMAVDVDDLEVKSRMDSIW